MINSQELRVKVKNEKNTFKDQVHNLKQMIGGFSGDNLLNEIEKLEKQNIELQKTLEGTLFKHFLLVLEVERRGHAYESLKLKFDQLNAKAREERESYIISIKQNRKKMEQEISIRLGAELDNLTQAHKQEIRRYEERLRDQHNQISMKDQQLMKLQAALSQKEDEKLKWSENYKDLERSLQDTQHNSQLQLTKMKAAHEDELRRITEDNKNRVNQLRNQFDSQHHHDLKNLETQLTQEFKVQIENYRNNTTNAQNEISRRGAEIEQLNRELNSLNEKYIVNNDQNNKLADKLNVLQSTHSQTIMRMKKEFEDKLAQEIYNKEKALGDHHKAGVTQLKRELKNFKDIVLKLENNEAFLKNEKQRLAFELESATKDKEEWRSRFNEIKVNNERQIHQLTIEKTTIIERNSQEIERLTLQLQSERKMHSSEKSQMAQDVNLKQEQLNQMAHDLQVALNEGETRKNEIEKWRATYANYVTGEQLEGIQNDLKKFRAQKMDLEDENLLLKNKIQELHDNKNAFANQLESLKSQLVNSQSINNRRKVSLIEAQDKLDIYDRQLKSLNSEKVNIDADKMNIFQDNNRMKAEIIRAQTEAVAFKKEADSLRGELDKLKHSYRTQINSIQEFKTKTANPVYQQNMTSHITTVRSSGVDHHGQPANMQSSGYYRNPEERQSNYQE